jgi:hypothetical protein
MGNIHSSEDLKDRLPSPGEPPVNPHYTRPSRYQRDASDFAYDLAYEFQKEYQPTYAIRCCTFTLRTDFRTLAGLQSHWKAISALKIHPYLKHYWAADYVFQEEDVFPVVRVILMLLLHSFSPLPLCTSNVE